MSYRGDEEYVTGVMRPPRRWPLALAAAALATAAVVTAVLVADDDDEGRPRAGASPSPSASASPTASPSDPPSPSDSPSPTDTAVAAPTASPSPAPTPRPDRTATVAPTRPAASRTPAPTRAPAGYPPKGLVLEVEGEPIEGDPPQVRFRIRVRDNDGNELEGVIDYGDGTRQVFSRRPAATCPTPPTSPPPGYQPAPIDRRFTVTHAYEYGGSYTVTVTATTGRTCSGTPEESARRQLLVTVPPRPEVSPTFDPSPFATPTPSGAARP